MTNEGAIVTPYDVFLSYSSDTRKTFTANLYSALRDKRIKTFFRDDDKLPRSGNQLTSPSILNALEESKISIVVLSKDYAYSMRCLAQLVKIIDCMKSRGQLVWPIFYGVDPSDVRYQRGSYAQAMVAHENMFKDDHKKVLEWRSALSEVANLDDRWLLKIGRRYESKLIRKVVEHVAQRTPSYDVFLSFSEKDSRYSFTSFLYNALNQEGFKTFINDEGLEDGDQIPLSIIKAIEGSKFIIIVLSENYAYSSSSLDQLVRILVSRKMTNQMVWPIFYKVEPTEVRHQKNSYCEAMKAHEYRLGEGSKKVEEWRLALKQVANLKGWSLKTRYEYKFIQEIMAIMKLPPAHTSCDIYVSFSGKDNRGSGMNNLNYVLRDWGIKALMDDGEFKTTGDSISHTDYKEALEESRISIVVLSQDYAHSTWCLDRLVQMLDCRKRKDQQVWPIFYEVVSSDVKNQRNMYGKAMEAHKIRFGENSDKVQKWRSALSKVASLKGLEFNTGSQNQLIQSAVGFAVEFLFIDVFLSFSGEDTRYSFTGFLYNALRQEEFKTFMDDEGLKGGDEISETLIRTIKQSRLSIIVFSENYAYSSWCLDELVIIIERKNLKKQLVLPIFYKVEKSDVCNQEKSYGDAMAEHGNMYGNDSKKVQKWRSALSDVANLEGGEHIKENESEYEFINKIVGMVRARLSTDR